jgi:hypothetical protein
MAAAVKAIKAAATAAATFASTDNFISFTSGYLRQCPLHSEPRILIRDSNYIPLVDVLVTSIWS